MFGGIIKNFITINHGIERCGALSQFHCTVIPLIGLLVLFPLTQLLDINTRRTLEVYGPTTLAPHFNFPS